MDIVVGRGCGTPRGLCTDVRRSTDLPDAQSDASVASNYRRMRRITVRDVDTLLRSRAELLASGVTERRLRHAVATGEWRRVRRGWFVTSKAWRELWPEGQHLVHLVAVARDAKDACPVFAGPSAAAVLDLPLYRHRPAHVHVRLTGDSRTSNSADVKRHEGDIRDDDIVTLHGLRLTVPALTVADTARSLPLATALAVADASLRLAAIDGHDYDLDRADAWRTAVMENLERSRHGRGVAQARWIASFADGRAQLPGETGSRLQFHRLGLTPDDLQVHIPGPNGTSFWSDFGIEKINSFGEFDGKGKYTDPAMLQGRSLQQVLLDEKAREDWIRSTTRRLVLRWGDKEASSEKAMAQFLITRNVDLPPASERHHPPYS